MAEALGRSSSDRDEVSGSRVEVGEHVVGLVLQLRHRSPRSGDVDTWIRRLNALVADLLKRGRKQIIRV